MQARCVILYRLPKWKHCRRETVQMKSVLWTNLFFFLFFSFLRCRRHFGVYTFQAVTFVGVRNGVDNIWVNWLLQLSWPWGTLALTSPTPSGFWCGNEAPGRWGGYSGWWQAARGCPRSSGHCPCGSQSWAAVIPSVLTCSHPLLVTYALILPSGSLSCSAIHLHTSSGPLTTRILICHHSTPHTSWGELTLREGVPPGVIKESSRVNPLGLTARIQTLV